MPIPKFTLRGFRRPSETVEQTLGELEREVMEHVWKKGETSVREMHTSFGERAAYTTLMTTLNRLHKKRLLKRRKDGRAFLYSPRISREDFKQSVAKDIISGLLGRDAEPVLACIVEAIGERDGHLLNELDRLLQEKRQALGPPKKKS